MTDGHARRNEETFTDLVAAEEEHLRWQSEKVALIQRVLRRSGARGVLADVGCFTGGATVLFRSTGFERVVGFDSCEPALVRAAARGIEVRYWRAGAERCPAADEEFDFVVAADVIEHCVDTDALLGELRRILHRDGWLVVTTPNLAFWISRLRLLLGKVPWSYPGASPTVRADMKIDLNHIRITTRREWEALFRAWAFGVEDVVGWSVLGAMGESLGIRARRVVDRWMTRFPAGAFGLLFVLKRV